MQLRRAMEIVNTQDNNSNIFYKDDKSFLKIEDFYIFFLFCLYLLLQI